MRLAAQSEGFESGTNPKSERAAISAATNLPDVLQDYSLPHCWLRWPELLAAREPGADDNAVR